MCSGSWARFENEATYWNAGQRAYCPGPPRGMFLQISASCTFHVNVLSKAVAVVVVSVANLQVCASASARHNRTIRTHRSSCCLWPTTFAFAVCVTVLERTTIALCCIRCTTFQCTLDNPLITYIILCSPRVRTIEGLPATIFRCLGLRTTGMACSGLFRCCFPQPTRFKLVAVPILPLSTSRGQYMGPFPKTLTFTCIWNPFFVSAVREYRPPSHRSLHTGIRDRYVET